MTINRKLFTDRGSRWSYQPIPRDPFWLEILGGAFMAAVLALMVWWAI